MAFENSVSDFENFKRFSPLSSFNYLRIKEIKNISNYKLKCSLGNLFMYRWYSKRETTLFINLKTSKVLYLK